MTGRPIFFSTHTLSVRPFLFHRYNRHEKDNNTNINNNGSFFALFRSPLGSSESLFEEDNEKNINILNDLLDRNRYCSRFRREIF